MSTYLFIFELQNHYIIQITCNQLLPSAAYRVSLYCISSPQLCMDC